MRIHIKEMTIKTERLKEIKEFFEWFRKLNQRPISLTPEEDEGEN